MPSCYVSRVPVSVRHVAIGESSKELAKPNVWILAILAKSINISFSLEIAQIMKCFKIIVNLSQVLAVKMLPSGITPFFSKDAT